MHFYELLSHSDRFSYRAHLVSGATCALILCTTLTYLSPFLLTYYTGDFWTKESIYSEQPRVANTSKYILMIDNGDTTTAPFFLSSYATLNENFQNQLLLGAVTESSHDTDGDGLLDQFRFSGNIVFSSSTISIRSINLWLIYQYELRGKQHILMETMALMNFVPDSMLVSDGSKNITLYGALKFEQRHGVESFGSDSTYNKSIVDLEKTAPNFDSILRDYFARKYYTSFQPQYTWVTPSLTVTPESTVTVNAVVNIGRQSIRFVPSIWQELKWGWIQYISVLVPFMLVFDRLKLFVFSNHLVRTFMPLSPKRHKA